MNCARRPGESAQRRFFLRTYPSQNTYAALSGSPCRFWATSYERRSVRKLRRGYELVIPRNRGCTEIVQKFRVSYNLLDPM
jgi:hypothetical protein